MRCTSCFWATRKEASWAAVRPPPAISTNTLRPLRFPGGAAAASIPARVALTWSTSPATRRDSRPGSVARPARVTATGRHPSGGSSSCERSAPTIPRAPAARRPPPRRCPPRTRSGPGPGGAAPRCAARPRPWTPPSGARRPRAALGSRGIVVAHHHVRHLVDGARHVAHHAVDGVGVGHRRETRRPARCPPVSARPPRAPRRSTVRPRYSGCRCSKELPTWSMTVTWCPLWKRRKASSEPTRPHPTTMRNMLSARSPRRRG